MRNTRNVFISLGIILTLAGGYLLYTFYKLGAFYPSKEEHTESWNIISFLSGPEDMEYDQASGYIYGISFDRWARDSLSSVAGSIWKMKPEEPFSPDLLTGKLPTPFHPHGMSLYREDSILWLFVINHAAQDQEIVEIFRIIHNDLVHVRSIQAPEIVSANDLVAISPGTFYLVNDGRSRDPFIRGMDIFFNRRTGNILYYDGTNCHLIADKLAFPNGIALNQNNSELYVSETIGGKLWVFQRNASHHLRVLESIAISTGLDNISVDQNGTLWIAVQPNLLAVNKLLKTPSYSAPSGVIIVRKGQHSWNPQWMVKRKGNRISGTSVVLHAGGWVITGSVCQPKIAVRNNEKY